MTTKITVNAQADYDIIVKTSSKIKLVDDSFGDIIKTQIVPKNTSRDFYIYYGFSIVLIEEIKSE